MLPVLPYVAANLRTTLRLLSLVEAKHPHEPHWYLASLGTAVDQQGKGMGGALMRPVLEHCDAEGIPCYLESSKERNLPFYRRHGFEVVEEVPLPGRRADASGPCGGTPTAGLRAERLREAATLCCAGRVSGGGGCPRAWRGRR